MQEPHWLPSRAIILRLTHSAHLLCLDRDLFLCDHELRRPEEYSGMAESAAVFRKKRLTKSGESVRPRLGTI